MVAREGSAAVPGDPDRLAPLSRPESWLPAATLAAFGLNARPFGDAAAATLYVACVMSMQS